MNTPPITIEPGALLAGKYRIERKLGAGGMGFVMAAMHLELRQMVAVKFLHTQRGQDQDGMAVARFLREARAAASIQSEHVARVIDVSRLENGEPYTVMEFLEGEDLQALVEKGPLRVDEVVSYVVQACHAIAEAHVVGIVHRDLKPSNLFLAKRSDGTSIIKVLDFGISKLTAPDFLEPALTNASLPMGSPLYMSPEQMRSSRDVDARTDIWSLGVILFELLTGQLPFTGESFTELVAAVLSTPPASLRGLRPDVPVGLEAVVSSCLQKEPGLRIQSVIELVRALRPFAPQDARALIDRIARSSGNVPSRLGSATEAMPPPDSTKARDSLAEAGVAVATTAQKKATDAPWSNTRGHEAPPPRKSKGPLLAVGVAVPLLVVGVVAFTLQGGHSSPPSPPVLVSALPVVVQTSAPAGPALTTSAVAPVVSVVPAPRALPEAALPTASREAKHPPKSNKLRGAAAAQDPASGAPASGAPAIQPLNSAATAPPRRSTLAVELKE